MENKIISLRHIKYEKQYREFYSNINNYNRALMMVGTAPKNMITFKKEKLG